MWLRVNLLRITGKETIKSIRFWFKKELKGILGWGHFLVQIILAKYPEESGGVVFCLQSKGW